MKYICFLFVFLTVTNLHAKADREVIIQLMNEQEAAWNKGDLKAFMQGYWRSDKLAFIGKNGIKYGWQTTLANYKASYPDKAAMGKLKFDIMQVEVEGDSAFVLGKWKLIRQDDAPAGFFTLYWKKIEGAWRIVIDHSS